MADLKQLEQAIREAIGDEGVIIKATSDHGLSVTIVGTRVCADPKCGVEFAPKRNDMVYCGRQCASRVRMRRYMRRKRMAKSATAVEGE